VSTASAETATERGRRRSFWLGVVNGSLSDASLGLMDMTVVVSVLAANLVGSKALVGLLVSLFAVGWVWPSLYMPWVLEGKARKLPWYRWSAVVRVSCFGSVGLVLFSPLPERSPALAFWAIAALLFTMASAGGVSQIPFIDLVAQNVPVHRRGIFWSLRQGIGAVMSVGGATLVRVLLDPLHGPPFPRGHAWLFVLGAAVHGVAVLAFSLTYEEPRPERPRRMTLRMHAVRGMRLLARDPRFLAYALVRAVLALAVMGTPFLALFCKARFGMTDGDTASFLVLCSIAGVVLPFVWGAICDRRGSRAGLRVAACLVALSSTCALLAVALHARTQGVAPGVWGLLGVSFVAGYAVTSCAFIALQNHLLELAPARKRETYIGFSNILAIPLAFTSILAGVIAEYVSLEALYFGGVVLGIAGLVLALRYVSEPRHSRR
jgi:MFS family permease